MMARRQSGSWVDYIGVHRVRDWRCWMGSDGHRADACADRTMTIRPTPAPSHARMFSAPPNHLRFRIPMGPVKPSRRHAMASMVDCRPRAGGRDGDLRWIKSVTSTNVMRGIVFFWGLFFVIPLLSAVGIRRVR